MRRRSRTKSKASTRRRSSTKSKASTRSRRGRKSESPALTAASREYARQVKEEFERLFALGQGFATEYDPVVEVEYEDDSMASTIFAVSSQLLYVSILPPPAYADTDDAFIRLALTHDREMPHLAGPSHMSVARRALGLARPNHLYIVYLRAGFGFSGTDIMEKVLQFARCFDYRQVGLDDQSELIATSGTGGECRVPLGAFFLLTKGERWYSKFGFELAEQVKLGKTGERVIVPPARVARAERGEVAMLKEMRLIDITAGGDKEELLHSFFHNKLGDTWKAATLGDLFGRLASRPLDYSSLCGVAEVFKALKPILRKNLMRLSGFGAPMLLELPNRFQQMCYDHFSPLTPSALLSPTTMRRFRAGI